MSDTDSTEKKICVVAVEGCTYSFDALFSYIIPEEMLPVIECGLRVLVPFGRNNKLKQGIIFEISDMHINSENELKYIHSILDSKPLFSNELLLLVKWMHDRCFCTYFNCAKAVLPGGMFFKQEKEYYAEKDIDPDILSSLNETENNIFNFITSKKKHVKESIIHKQFAEIEISVPLKKLIDKKVLCENVKFSSRVNDLSIQTYALSDNYEYISEDICITDKQKQIIELFSDNYELTLKEICYYTGCGESVVKKLIQNGILKIIKKPVSRSPVRNMNKKNIISDIILTEQQDLSYRKMYSLYKNNTFNTMLLYGITGSGKTKTYLKLIDDVLSDGKSVIVLVPEISLTPQTFLIFLERYGENIAILHSGLSMGERHDEWHRINDGKAKIVIGTRSAIFAPLKNLGLIVIDEEQEHTYKSENSPRYNAKEIAKFRCAYNNSLLVLVSATPSIESYAKAISKKYYLTELTERYGPALLPDVQIVDLSNKDIVQPYMSLSNPLIDAIELNLKNKEQSILLVNRRGYNTFVVCSDCKEVITCPKCSISLTYHNINNRLMCHYCGYSVDYTDKCPSCGGENIKYSGSGTQKIEKELELRFPNAKVLRMDADTTLGKDAHNKILSSFGAGEYDILIGTQMVAKGLDFPNVTLVGIVSADNELYNTDFRSAEKSFSLITQVVGRAGRGSKKGRAVIQTLTPDNNTINIAAVQDYKKFYSGEIALRKAMIYPPFCDIVEISFSGTDKEKTTECANKYFELLKKKNQEIYSNLKIIVLGPLSPRVSKINNFYRSRLIIKCKNSNDLRTCVHDTLIAILKDKAFKDIKVYADMNPENLN